MEQKRCVKEFYTVPFVWNKTLWVMTFALFGLWIGLSGYMLYEIFTEENTSETLVGLIILNVTMLPMMVACEGLAPQRLEIGADKLIILRRYKSIVVHREEVKSVEPLPSAALRMAVRTCGVGGFFGYFGHYYTPILGAFRLYATSFDNLFVIEMWNGKKIVISCSEPDKMSYFI